MGKGESVSDARATIVANNYSDKDWAAGAQTKESHKNMFYFLNDTSVMHSVDVGTKLIFANSGVASVTKVDTIPQGGRTVVFVTVDRDLDPVGDGFPHQILIQ